MKNSPRVDPDDDGSPDEDDGFLDERKGVERRLLFFSSRNAETIQAELDRRAQKLARSVRDFEKTIPH